MATITWPATLPQTPEEEGYASEDQDVVLRSSMDTGEPKLRARFTSAAEYIECRFIMTSAELVIFKEFYRVTTGRGAVRFNMPHPETSVTTTARFRSPPKRTPLSTRWVVSMSLEFLPGGLLITADGDTFITSDGDTITVA